MFKFGPPGIITITIIAFIVRAVLASWTGLATDEANGVMIAVSGSWSDMLLHLKNDGNAPLFYAVIRLLDQELGHSDIVVKSIAVTIATMVVPFCYLLFRSILPKSICLQLAWILAFCPSFVRYGTLVRPYAMVSMLGLLSSFYCIKILTKDSSRLWIAPYGISTVLVVYTHYWGAFVPIGQACLAVVGYFRKWFGKEELKNWILGVIVSLLLFAPQVETLIYQLKHDMSPWDIIRRPIALIPSFLPGIILDIGARITFVDQLSTVLCDLIVVVVLASTARYVYARDKDENENPELVQEEDEDEDQDEDESEASSENEIVKEEVLNFDPENDSASQSSKYHLLSQNIASVEESEFEESDSSNQEESKNGNTDCDASCSPVGDNIDSDDIDESTSSTSRQDIDEIADNQDFDSSKWKTLVVCGLVACFVTNFILPSMRFRYILPFVPMIIVIYLVTANVILKDKSKFVKYVAPCLLWIMLSLPQLQVLAMMPETNTGQIVDIISRRANRQKDLVVITWQIIAPAINFYLPRDIECVSYPDLKRSDFNHWPEMHDRVKAGGKLARLKSKVLSTLDQGGAIWLVERARDIADADLRRDVINEDMAFESTFTIRMDQVHKWLQQNAKQSGEIMMAPGRDFPTFLTKFVNKNVQDVVSPKIKSIKIQEVKPSSKETQMRETLDTIR